jgi:hypothetical protein
MPYSEFKDHKWFWENFKWGMQDDILAIGVCNHLRSQSSKANVSPWMVKQWTLQSNYTYRVTKLITKPVAAIRSGFMAMVDAIKASTNVGNSGK